MAFFGGANRAMAAAAERGMCRASVNGPLLRFGSALIGLLGVALLAAVADAGAQPQQPATDAARHITPAPDATGPGAGKADPGTSDAIASVPAADKPDTGKPDAASPPPLPSARKGAKLTPIRVRLSWFHQAQNAGFYVALRQRYFAAEGLDVQLQQGDANSHPIDAIINGTADVAEAALTGASEKSKRGRLVTNIAQIFQSDPLRLICRNSAGVFTPADIVDKAIGTTGGGDEQVVRRMIRAIDPSGGRPHFVIRDEKGSQLVNWEVACVTGVTYNEYWRILEAGVPADDLLVIRPASFGAADMSDGLYVMRDRLESEEFRLQMARLVRALGRGWEDARRYPSLALDAVLEADPSLDRDDQRQMLEAVLALVPPKSFGLFDLNDFAPVEKARLQQGVDPEVMKEIWTHRIWHLAQELPVPAGEQENRAQRTSAFTKSTLHYVRAVFNSKVFSLTVLFGTWAFALSAVLLAIQLGYGLWGRFVLAMVASMGGGVLRDILIGNARQPFYFIDQLEYPLGILVITLVVTVLTARRTGKEANAGLVRLQWVAEVIGFAVIAVNGAFVALISDMPWYWAPFCSALACTGGGLLQDVLINREPAAFRGALFEEIALVTGLAVVGGLWLANSMEHSALPVYITAGASFILAAGLLEWVNRTKPRLPPWLGGPVGK